MTDTPDPTAIRVSLSKRIGRIAQKVSRQGVSLGPPVSATVVAAFEAKHGIELPEGYRAFISEIGDGGEGPPFYGMDRLERPAADMRREERMLWQTLPHVREPFPFSTHWIWDQGERSDEGTQADVDKGSIYIGNEGCGMYWHLIVTGSERGNVWTLSGEGIQPTAPKRDFLTWYEDWLDGKGSWYALGQPAHPRQEH